MTDSRTWHSDHSASTHPGTEGKFDVLSAPDFEAFVEGTDVVEVLFVDCDGTADEGW